MTQTLQAIQLILFAIPIMALFGFGVAILIKPIRVINRRWYLLIYLPLLLANPLLVLESFSVSEVYRPADWRLWLILLTDVVLIGAIIHIFRGFLVFGLSADDTEAALIKQLQAQGYDTQRRSGKKRNLMGKAWDSRILTARSDENQSEIWITERTNEVLIQLDGALDRTTHRRNLLSLQGLNQPYHLKTHTMGFLYLVLAMVFAVLSWILFFEPRLVIFS